MTKDMPNPSKTCECRCKCHAYGSNCPACPDCPPTGESSAGEWEKEYESLAHAYFEPGGKTYWDGIEFGKSFVASQRTQVLEEVRGILEKSKLSITTREYDGNDLSSACDFYGIFAKNWAEILRFENGYDSAISDFLTKLSKLT